MYYKIVEKFDSQSIDKWQSYLNWRVLNLTSFDSVDSILRPNLFEPESDEDWSNCVNENCKLNLLTNLDYAMAILARYENAVLVGVEIELQKEYQPKKGLLGFDIIDSYCDISLVTNWGTDKEGIINQYVMNNELIADLEKAIQIRDLLRKKFSEDSHAENCQVWAVYKVNV